MNIYFGGLLAALWCWAAIFIAARQSSPAFEPSLSRIAPGNILLPLPRSTKLPSHASLRHWTTNPDKEYNTKERYALEQRATKMFYHGYNNYMQHAFPHDDLRPISKAFTDSLGNLGGHGVDNHGPDYKGVALSLIDSLSTLAVLGDIKEFEKSIRWVSKHISFDVDVQVNVFEANIRLLGGLLSAHQLAQDLQARNQLAQPYHGDLLAAANRLGLRLLPAFHESPTGCPYPWINLRHGMDAKSKGITETNVAACGSLILEMGTLSRLTGNPIFEDYAMQAIHSLMERRSIVGLFGSRIDMRTMEWIDHNGGIGASSDSFYEYLLKAYLLFGIDQLWEYFKIAYIGALNHYKVEPWYHDASWLGQPTFIQFSSLQAFWPGLQVLLGDLLQAMMTFDAFMSVWVKFGVLPERYYFSDGVLHSSENYYPLRPELIESNFYLYQATGDQRYLRNGEIFMDSLDRYTRVSGGWASVRNVITGEKEDHMQSYFLAETCKYLFLLYNSTFLKDRNVIFTTEGHPLFVTAEMQKRSHLLPTAPSQFQPVKPKLPQPREVQLQSALSRMVQQLVGANQPEQKGPLQCSQGPYGQIICNPANVDDPAEQKMPKLGKEASDAQQTSLQQMHPSALTSQTCPWFGKIRQSVCHVPDRFPDHHCTTSSDCGTDQSYCRQKECVDVSGKLSCASRLPPVIQQIVENIRKKLSSNQVLPQNLREQMVWQYAATLAKVESERLIWPHYGQDFVLPDSLGKAHLGEKLQDEAACLLDAESTCIESEHNIEGISDSSEINPEDMGEPNWVSVEDWLRHQTGEFYQLLLREAEI